MGVAAGNVVVLARRAWGHEGVLPHEVVCLLGSSGDVAWSHKLARQPLAINCALLDANRDGVPECLIAGQQDLLKAIDPLSGEKHVSEPPQVCNSLSADGPLMGLSLEPASPVSQTCHSDHSANEAIVLVR